MGDQEGHQQDDRKDQLRYQRLKPRIDSEDLDHVVFGNSRNSEGQVEHISFGQLLDAASKEGYAHHGHQNARRGEEHLDRQLDGQLCDRQVDEHQQDAACSESCPDHAGISFGKHRLIEQNHLGSFAEYRKKSGEGQRERASLFHGALYLAVNIAAPAGGLGLRDHPVGYIEQNADGDQCGDSFDDLLCHSGAGERTLCGEQNACCREAGGDSAYRADVNIFEALLVSALHQICNDGGDHQDGLQAFSDNDAEGAEEGQKSRIGGLLFCDLFCGILLCTLFFGLCSLILLVDSLCQLQDRVFRRVGAGPVLVLLILFSGGSYEVSKSGKMLLHGKTVFQGKVRVDRVIQAGFLVHRVIGGVQIVLGCFEIFVQISHIGGIQKFLDKSGGFVPVFIFCRRIGIGRVLGIRIGIDQLSFFIVLGLALHASLHGSQLVAVLADHAFQLFQSAPHGNDGFLIGVVFFDCGLAGGKLHLHRVLAVA